MSQINYKSKYLKYKAKYLFIKSNQIDQEYRSSHNLLNGGAAGSVPSSAAGSAAGSVEEQQIKQLDKQLQELETKYNNDLLQLNRDKEKYINDLKENNIFATGNPLDVPTSETYDNHYYYNNNDKQKLDEQYKQDKQKILTKIQLLKSPVPSTVLLVPAVIQTSTPPIQSAVTQTLTPPIQTSIQSAVPPINYHYFEIRDAEK
jgi:hypothetical protein